MQARGIITGISRDFTSGRYNLTIELTEGDVAAVDALRGEVSGFEAPRFGSHAGKSPAQGVH